MLLELIDAIDNGTADVLFVAIVLLSFILLMVMILFLGLAIRDCWRWLTRRSWKDVIVYVERKALK